MQIFKRVVTALTTATLVVLGLLYVPFGVVLPVMIALVTLVHLEFSQMVARKYEIMTGLGVVSGLVYLIATFYFPDGGERFDGWSGIALSALFALFWLAALFGKSERPLAAAGVTLLGFVYLPLMLKSLILLPKEHGMTMLLYVIAIVKFSDMGGFALGMAFGKHKMCPKISPKKSWEGMAGSILASVLMSCAFVPLTHFGWGKAAAFGVAAAVIGTLGDLVESRFKRECGVKDSATFMPAGLGGFLDMFDSLVFAPAALLPFI